jgi:hypothetical protein
MALRHTPEARLFLLILISYAYFHHGASWNQIARVDPILSFVEPGTPDHQTLRIDHFVVLPESGRNTGDWARNPRVGEHYYSNKAPGPSFLGVPIYCVLYKVESAMGAVPESHGWPRLSSFVCFKIRSTSTRAPPPSPRHCSSWGPPSSPTAHSSGDTSAPRPSS